MSLTVQSLIPNASGFDVQFNEAINGSLLNLYDAQNATQGDADVTLQGSSSNTPVRGSLVLDSSGTRLSFIATGDPLAADNYTVTLRSAANGIVDQALGQLLDGEYDGSFPSGNGTASGDFVYTFTVEAPRMLVVGMPDFARGPTQAVNVPAQGSGEELSAGLPITFSDAAGVTSATLTLACNPDLLTITAVQLGPDAPADSRIESDVSATGQVTIAFTIPGVMPAGSADLILLTASVPDDASYGAAEVLKITDLQVRGVDPTTHEQIAIQATADDSLHVVAFPGDADCNGQYDTEDARLIARVHIGLDTGFAVVQPTSPVAAQPRTLWPTVDPLVLGDVTGEDGLTRLDVSDVLGQLVGLSAPDIPAVPAHLTPTDILVSASSMAENQEAGTAVGTLRSVGPDSTTCTYSLVAGTGSNDNASFTIAGNQLKTAASFDYETKTCYTIRVRSTNDSGLHREEAFVISTANVNEGPTAVALSSNTVAEDQPAGTVVGTLSSADPDTADAQTYSLVSGTGNDDNARFTIVGSQLQTAAAFDVQTKGVYAVRVRSTDAGGLFTEQAFTITVSGVALSTSTVAENQAAGTVVGDFSTIGQSGTLTYSLVSGTGSDDNASFAIDGSQLKTAAAFDCETTSSYTIRVRSTAEGGSFMDHVFTIGVRNVNEAPMAVALSNSSVAENPLIGTAIGTLSTADPDAGDSFTYTFVAGEGDTDNASFAIEGGQLKAAASIDFETKSSYSIRVRSADQGGLSTESVLTIAVTDGNETPTAVALSNSTVAENQAAATVVGTLSTSDPDAGDSHTYILTIGDGGTDHASFAIVGSQLTTSASFDFETRSTYSVRVKTTDQGGLSAEQVFAISVTDANDVPTAIALSAGSVPESQPVGTLVGILSTSDRDAGDDFTYSLVTGEGADDNASFSIVGGQLRTAASFDFETKSSYSIRVRSTDQGGLSTEQAFTITVTNVNEAPTAIALSNTSVAENQAIGTAVGTLSATDPETGDTHTYSLVSGDGASDNGSFTIVGNQLKTAASFDFETKSSYAIRIRATDQSGLSTDRTFTISVTDVANPPALSGATVKEAQPIGTVVGSLSMTDPAVGASYAYMLVTGEGSTDNSSFTVAGSELKTAAVFDAAIKNSYSIRVRSTDQGEVSTERAFTITMISVNEAPTAIALSDTSVAENQASGTLVGMLNTTDPDAGDTHTYTLVTGDGASDNASFIIVGSQLKTAVSLNNEAKSSYSIRVRSTDQGGLSTERAFAITVTDVNEAPTTIALSNTSVTENQASGTVVGMLSTTDPDTIDTLTYTLVTGDGATDNASFVITGNQLKTAAVLQAATKSNYSVRIRSTDVGSLFTEQTFVITVGSATTYIKLQGSSTVVEGSGATAVGSVVTITSAGTYSISGTLNDGRVIVDSADADSVKLVLNGANITCSTTAPIYVANADKTVITLTEGTENYVTEGASHSYPTTEEPNAAIFSKDDLTINGTGSLRVNANFNNGIASKDDLKINGGKITVSAVGDGLRGRDSITIKEGTITVTAGGDGLQSNNDEDAGKGFFSMEGGTLTVTAGADGIQAATTVLLSGGSIAVTSGGGSTSSTSTETAKGIKAVVAVTIDGGIVGVNSRDDALHCGGALAINSGTLTLASADDAIHSDTAVAISGGNISITKCYEGVEAPAITIGDATINIASTDDGIGAVSIDGASSTVSILGGTFTITAGGDGIGAESKILISGGVFTITTGGGSSKTVSADASAKAIKSDADLTIDGGTFTINSADDALHCNNSLAIKNGNFTMATADDGIHADSSITIDGGTIAITKCYEGIESLVTTVNNGTIHVVSSDDGFNGSDGSGGGMGGGGQTAGKAVTHINGGYIVLDTAGDGFDVNGSATMSGGTLIVNGPTRNDNGAIDYDGSFVMSGGLLVAVGSAGMAQAPSTSSTQKSLSLRYGSVQTAGAMIHIETEAGEEILTFVPTKAYQSVVVCSPRLTTGTTYVVYSGGSSTGTLADGLYSGGTYTAGTKLGSVTLS